MLISGIQQFTMLDFPQKTACILWTAGCDFRCGYCHNPEFVLPEKLKELKGSFIKEEALFSFLKKRQGKLDGVVISGGEPTMHKDLPELMNKIKKMGFLVKLDTNGNNPFMLKKLIDEHLLDYVAMDIKTCFDTYSTLVGCRAKEEFLKWSVALLQQSGVPYEFRSTLIQEIHTPAVLQQMARDIKGAPALFLQTFRPEHTLDPQFEGYHPFSDDDMQDICSFFTPYVESVCVRR